ncbi:MAG: hypothetical protein QX192_03235 [Methylococcales bacterium]
MNIKQRLNSLEIALTPRQYETKFIRTTLCGYDSDSVTGYSANGLTIERNENESLDDFDARAKIAFSDNHNGKGIIFIRSLYIDDNNNNTTGG